MDEFDTPQLKVFVSGRQTGKTTKILEWMQEAEGVTDIRICVCHSHMRAMQLYRSTWDEDSNPTWARSWQFVGVEELKGQNTWAGVYGHITLGIDDLDLVLQSLILGPYPIDFVTIHGVLYEPR